MPISKPSAEARVNDTLDARSLNKIVELRNSASITVFITRMSRDVDEEYKRLKISQLLEDVFVLLGVIKIYTFIVLSNLFSDDDNVISREATFLKFWNFP